MSPWARRAVDGVMIGARAGLTRRRGQQLTGSYTFFNGSSTGIYTCFGSGEQPWFGVGRSNGPGGTCKTLPIYNANPSAGAATICQDCPNAFLSGVCAGNVAVYVR